MDRKQGKMPVKRLVRGKHGTFFRTYWMTPDEYKEAQRKGAQDKDEHIPRRARSTGGMSGGQAKTFSPEQKKEYQTQVGEIRNFTGVSLQDAEFTKKTGDFLKSFVFKPEQMTALQNNIENISSEHGSGFTKHLLRNSIESNVSLGTLTRRSNYVGEYLFDLEEEDVKAFDSLNDLYDVATTTANCEFGFMEFALSCIASNKRHGKPYTKFYGLRPDQYGRFRDRYGYKGMSEEGMLDLFSSGNLSNVKKIPTSTVYSSVKLNQNSDTRDAWIRPVDGPSDVLAYELDSLLGFDLVPPCANRTLDSGGMVLVRPQIKGVVPYFQLAAVGKETFNIMSVFDYLTGNEYRDVFGVMGYFNEQGYMDFMVGDNQYAFTENVTENWHSPYSSENTVSQSVYDHVSKVLQSNEFFNFVGRVESLMGYEAAEGLQQRSENLVNTGMLWDNPVNVSLSKDYTKRLS